MPTMSTMSSISTISTMATISTMSRNVNKNKKSATLAHHLRPFFGLVQIPQRVGLLWGRDFLVRGCGQKHTWDANFKSIFQNNKGRHQNRNKV